MPLVAASLMSYAAGLLLGFGGVVVPAAAAVGIMLLFGLLTGRAILTSVVIVAAAGIVVARTDLRTDLGCRQRALRASEWHAVPEDAMSPGAFVRARVVVGGCDLRVWVSVERGQAVAGQLVRLRGDAVVSRRGLKITHAIVHPASQPPGVTLRALHDRAGRAIDAVFRRDAPLVRALLIADTHGLDPLLRERYAAAGIIHMLSISGLHVAIIAAAMQLLFQAFRFPRTFALIATIVVTAFYIAVIGAPPPALRAGVMLGVVAVSRLAQRPTSPWAALAVGAAAPLFNPRTVLDLGYQLSVIGMAGLVASASLSRRWIESRLDGLRAQLARMVLASVVTSLVTAPLVAWSFGRVSIIAPVANIVAAPIIGFAQPALFLGLLLAPVPAIATFVADASHVLLTALDATATFFSGVPYAALDVAPTLAAALLTGVATAALVVACVSYFPARAAMVALAAMTVIAWLPLAPQKANGVELHAIDVGQGDAVALRTPRGRWVLFDAGRAWRGGDAGRSSVIPYVRRRGGEVAAFILSHPHSDHVGGASSVLRALRPHTYWDGAYLGGAESYHASLLTAARIGTRWRRVHPNTTLDVDGVSIRFLAPDSSWLSTIDDPNEGSVVALVRYRDVRFLLVGDAERGEEAWLMSNASSWLRADVLKVGHHGSVTSSTRPFLAAVRPRISLVSVGAGNGYGHPSAHVLAGLAAAGSQVLRTDRQGTIIVRTDGRSITVEAEGDIWALPR